MPETDEFPSPSAGTASERHPGLADRERSVLLVIDLQESYRGNLYEERRVARATARLLDAARILDVPVILTEQYPERLGSTWPELAALVPDGSLRAAKRSFSALGAPAVARRLGELREQGRDQIVLAGIETHVCVSQTAHDLLGLGHRVQLPRDAITARFALEDENGFAKMVGAGGVPTSVEGTLFEWVVDSRAPQFKAVHALVV